MASEPADSSQTPWSHVKVFLPPNTAGPSHIPPPPSEEPKPTSEELKSAFTSVISKRNGPDAPLMTKAMREREDARLGIKKKEYNEIRIRVRFSDRTALEGLFPATTRIPTLYAFVRAHLAPKYASIPFTIYQSPPRRDLPEKGDIKLQDKTIKDLGMAPQAIINLRWSDDKMNGNTFPAPLDSSISAQAQELPVPVPFDTIKSDSGSANQQPQTASSSEGTTKKVRIEDGVFDISSSLDKVDSL
jgi:tether containing UBX domain for GLUT4